MAERAARIRLMLNSGSFLGGMSQVGDTVDSLGRRLRNVLSNSAKAGMSAFTSSVKSTVGQVSGLAGQLAGLAGGFSVAASAKEAVDLQHEYRNLAQQVNRLVDSGKDWRDIQAIIEGAADRTGQSVQKVIPAFREIFTETGDLKYTVAAIESIGTAATGSGEQIGLLANPMQLAARKFGISADQTNEAVARIIEKVGVGGASLESMNGRFALMAGEAADAGIRGTEGLSQLLGVMLTLDSRVGEKASMGLKSLFQTMKTGSSQLKNLKKSSGIKFTDDEGAFDKIRKLIATDKGRKAAEVTFTAEARVVYDQLAMPFAQAYKAAKDSGKGVKEATAAGLEAYDKALGEMTKSNADFAKLQAQANERLREDPSVKIRHAMDKLAMEFTKPKMMAAIDTLAEALPKVASGIATFLQFLTEHPVTGVATVVGGKAALSGLGGFGSTIGKSILSAIVGQGTKSALGGIATNGAVAGAALQQVGSGAGLANRALMALANASGMKEVVGTGTAAASTALALAGVGVAAYTATTALLKMRDESEQKGVRTANDIFFASSKEISEAKTPEARKAALDRGRQKLTDSIGFWDSPAAASKAIKSLEEMKDKFDTQALNESSSVFVETMSRQSDTGDKATKSLERMTRAAEKVSRIFDAFSPPTTAPSGSNGLPAPASGSPGFYPR